MRCKLYINSFLILPLLLIAGTVQAACTYNEAIMAYENGHSVRGIALMQMAANDGDARAARYLANIGDRVVNPVIGDSLVAGTSISSASDEILSTSVLSK